MFKKLTPDAILPKRQTLFSAGFDVFANEDKVISAGQTELIGLGIAIDLEQIKGRFTGAYLSDNGADEYFDEHAFTEFKERHYFELHIRSSLRAKGLTSLGTGIIDMDFVYPNEIKMVVHNPIKMVFVEPIEIGDEYVDISLTGSAYGAENPNTKSQSKVKINKGDKIGQLILLQHAGHLMPSEYTLDNERVGGFGHSGAR